MDLNISRKISSFKWFLTLGMVLYHSRSINGYNVVYNSLIDNKLLDLYVNFANHLGYVCMVFFFFISGFFLYYKAENIQGIFRKMKKRIKTLLVPFILWNIFVLIYKCIVGNVDISFYNVCNIFFFSPIAGPLWYLMALLLLMFFSPIFVYLKKHQKFNSVLFILIILFCLLINFNVIRPILNYERWWWHSNLLYYLPVYLIGSYIGMYYPQLISKNKYENKFSFILGIILIFIAIILWTLFDNSMFYSFYSIVELVGIWLILIPKFFSKKVPSYYSCAFYIYALHNPVLIPKFNEYSFAILNGAAINGFLMILIKLFELLCIFIISYLFSLLAKKIFSQVIYDGLTGGR